MKTYTIMLILLVGCGANAEIPKEVTDAALASTTATAEVATCKVAPLEYTHYDPEATGGWTKEAVIGVQAELYNWYLAMPDVSHPDYELVQHASKVAPHIVNFTISCVVLTLSNKYDISVLKLKNFWDIFHEHYLACKEKLMIPKIELPTK